MFQIQANKRQTQLSRIQQVQSALHSTAKGTGLVGSTTLGLTWWSSTEDSAHPLQEPQVLALVKELRSHMPSSN